MSDKKKSFEVSRSLNGKTYTFRGQEAENGWILTVTKEWSEEGDIDSPGQWHHEEKKFIAKESPLKDAEKKKMDEITDMLQSTFGSMDGIFV